jgi:hypothetical protein
MANNKVIETWQTPDGSWTWEVLRKYQKDDDKPLARWFCRVKSPYTPYGELGDTYVKDIKSTGARKVSPTLVQKQEKLKLLNSRLGGI